MGFNWGGFSSGLAQGVSTGMKLRSAYKEASEQNDISKLREKGMQEAREAAAKAQESAAASVQDTGEQGMEQSAVAAPQQAPVETFKVDMGPGAVAAQGIGSGAQGRYVVGGKAFNDKGKAEAHAKSKAPTDMDFFIKNAIPQVAAKYMEQGQPEMAEAWTQYASKKESQKLMETWGKAKRATMSGDFEGAADHVMDLYAGYDDGVTPMGKEVVKDKDGNVTGFNVKLKDDATGEVRAQFVSPQDLDSGLGALAPTEMFKMTMAKQQKAEEIQLRAAADAANDARTMQRDVAKQGMIENRADRREVFKAKAEVVKADTRGKQEIDQIRERAKLETDGLGAKAKAELNARTEILRSVGYSEDDINGMVPALLKVDSFKKGTSPEERRAMIVSDLIKGDPRFANLPPEKQKAQVDKVMTLVGEGAPATAPKPAAAKPKAVGQMVYDPATKGLVPIGR